MTYDSKAVRVKAIFLSRASGSKCGCAYSMYAASDAGSLVATLMNPRVGKDEKVRARLAQSICEIQR